MTRSTKRHAQVRRRFQIAGGWLNVLLLAAPASWVLAFTGGASLTGFLLAAASLTPAAGLIGAATEHLARRSGPTLGGLLNATFGNAAEMIIGILALSAGHTSVVKASITGSIIGKLIVFGYTWALIHHLLSGLRHFVWDLGYGFKANEREALTWGALIGGISLTVLVWIIAYTVGGGR